MSLMTKFKKIFFVIKKKSEFNKIFIENFGNFGISIGFIVHSVRDTNAFNAENNILQ